MYFYFPSSKCTPDLFLGVHNGTLHSKQLFATTVKLGHVTRVNNGSHLTHSHVYIFHHILKLRNWYSFWVSNSSRQHEQIVWKSERQTASTGSQRLHFKRELNEQNVFGRISKMFRKHDIMRNLGVKGDTHSLCTKSEPEDFVFVVITTWPSKSRVGSGPYVCNQDILETVLPFSEFSW